jgi:hypothetical protein
MTHTLCESDKNVKLKNIQFLIFFLAPFGMSVYIAPYENNNYQTCGALDKHDAGRFQGRNSGSERRVLMLFDVGGAIDPERVKKNREDQMSQKKIYAAYVSESDKFLVVAKSLELARAEVVNVAAMLFLDHGLVLKVIKVEEWKV